MITCNSMQRILHRRSVAMRGMVTRARSKRTIFFYFDYVSHNAYLAWTQIHSLAASTNTEVRPVPVLLGALFKHFKNTSPAELPSKYEWMCQNVVRKARSLFVPIKAPVAHPFNSLLALRATCLPCDRVQRKHLIDALFRAAWVERKLLSDPAVVATALEGALGVNGARAVEAASGNEVKAALKQSTDTAVADGVFGVPTMVVPSEGAAGERGFFFGFDDFPQLELFLAGADQWAGVPDEEKSRWRALKPEAGVMR
jgi:2-hydroxychromene-2-carboxylate isomerase